MTFNEIISGDVPVLVDFSAEWCGPCKMMVPILDQVKEQLGDDVKIIKIDTDRNQSLAMHFNIKGVPTLMIFKGGDLKWRQSGVIDANSLVSQIRMIN
ncbi:MAG: thioredoxin [Bacteroidetes bacterium]|nr:thioredoxin [Bacteroidota bacterium]